MATDRPVWQRLLTADPLEGAERPTVDGRVDLRGISVPQVKSKRKPLGGAVSEESGYLVVRNRRWKNLDLSDSDLRGLRFHGCSLDNCRFDNAKCAGWRVWDTTVTNTSFRNADMRRAVLGGVEADRRNVWRDVDFGRADMRETVYVSADMVSCRFGAARLKKVDFGGTVFENCVFQGLLEEVQFRRHAFRGERYPANEMRGVDLRGADLRYVGFRGLDMSDVVWPERDDQYVVENYPEVLDRLLALWGSRSDVGSKRLYASYSVVRKWVGAHQKVGVISGYDVAEAGGEEAVAEVLRMIGRKQ